VRPSPRRKTCKYVDALQLGLAPDRHGQPEDARSAHKRRPHAAGTKWNFSPAHLGTQRLSTSSGAAIPSRLWGFWINVISPDRVTPPKEKQTKADSAPAATPLVQRGAVEN